MRSASGDNEDEKKKKKVRVNLEPRSAHGRAVRKKNKKIIDLKTALIEIKPFS